MSMEVHNVKYNEVNKLLNNIYSKYININNSADARTPFIKDTLKKINIGEIQDVNFGLENSNYNIDKSSFTKLINEIIYCKLGNINVSNSVDIDNTNRTKGYLKFVKSHSTQAVGKVKIEKDSDIINNILSSMHLVNVFIDILDAYNSFLNETANLEHFKKKVNNIIIVNKNAKKYSDRSKTDKNYGYWIDSGIEANKPAISSLYLSINSYSGDANTNQLLQDFIVEYDATIGVVSNSMSSYSNTNEITDVNSGLFNNGGEIIDNSGAVADIITGIVINIPADGRPVIKQDKSIENPDDIILNDITNSNIQNSNLYEALLVRNKRLLKDFLNLIINFDLINRRTQINGLLTYFKVIKEYFYIALTSGNLLFNSYLNTITLTGSTVQAADMTSNDITSNSGYAIKYLNNSDIEGEVKKIYTDGTTNSIMIPKPSPITDVYNDSVFGIAKTENDEEYMNKIIDNLSSLQELGAKSANISNDTQQDISDKGFVAIVENKNTIKIKSRLALLNKLLNGTNSIVTSGEQLSNVSNISPPDSVLVGGTPITDNDSFKLDKLTNSNSRLPIDVKRFIYKLDSNKLSKNYIIRINNTTFPIKGIIAPNSNDVEFLISARLIYPTQISDELKDVPVLTLPYNKVTLFDDNDGYLGSSNTQPERYFNSLDEAIGKKVLFHYLNSQSVGPGVDNKVTLTIKKPLDYKSGYVNNLEKIKNINYDINSNESKIKNAKILYDLNKSKYNVLYYQLISYILILVGIIVALILTNTMNIPKSITKLVASVCFGIVVLQFVTYYILSVLYVEAFTSDNVIEKFSQTYSKPNVVGNSNMEFTSDSINKYPQQKVEFVQNQLILLNNKIIQALELANVGVGQASSTEAYTKLLTITDFERVSRGNINSILALQSDGSKMHIDLLKYSTSVHAVNIKTVLMLSLAIVGLFTINVYTDGKYMENLAFLGGFILIIILAYYLIYSNSVVRTRSNNVYWGKENKNNYSDI
jgi:hypothetical protein